MAGFGFLGVTSTQRSSTILTAEGSLIAYGTLHSRSGVVAMDAEATLTLDGTRHHRSAAASVTAEATFITTVSTSLLREVRQDNPVLLWRLNETSGTVAYDSSGNGNHGTYVGSPTLASGSVVTMGHDMAPYFSAGQSVVGDNLITLTAPYTIEGWFYRRPSSTDTFSGSVIGHRDIGGDEGSEIYLYIPAGGASQLISGRHDNNPSPVDGPYYDTTRQTMHVVFVVDSTVVTLYVNGEYAASDNEITNDWTSFYPYVCYDGGGYDGYIGWVAYYDTALSAARVLAHFEAEPLLTGSYLTAAGSQTVSGNALHRSGSASLTATSDAIIGAPNLLATVVDAGPSLAIPVEARVAGTLAIIVDNYSGTLNWDDIDGGPSVVGRKWYDKWAILDGTETTIELDAGFTGDYVVMFWENAELSWNKYGVSGIASRANSIPAGVGFTRDEVDPWSATIVRFDKPFTSIAFDEVGYTSVASATGWNVGLQKYVVFDEAALRPDIKAGFPSVMLERNGEDPAYDLTTWTVRPRRAYDQYVRDMDPTFWSFPNKSTTVNGSYNGLDASYESYSGPSPVDEAIPTLGRRFSWKSGGPNHCGFAGTLASDAFSFSDWSFMALMKRRPIEDLSNPTHQQYTIVATHATTPETSMRLVADWNDEPNLLTLVTSYGNYDVVEGFMDDGEWHLYAVTFDVPSYTLKMFIDGTEVLSEVLVGTLSGPQGMYFGTDNDSEAINSFYYNEFTFFNRLVMPAEIDDLVDILGVQRTPVLRAGSAALTGTSTEVFKGAGLLEVILTDNPTILWRLNETSGTTVTDYSGNTNHGTYVGGPALASGSVITSYDDKAPFFGDGQYAVAVDPQEFAVPFSMECWAHLPYDRPALYPGDTTHTVMDSYKSADYSGAIFKFDDITGNLFAQFGVGGYSAQSLDYPASNYYQPHHYVLVCDVGETSLYIDGVLRDSFPGTATGYLDPFYPTIGRNAITGNDYLGGTVGWAAWYEHALTADRIYGHFRAGPIPGRSHMSAVANSDIALGYATHYGIGAIDAHSYAIVNGPEFIDAAYATAGVVTIPVAAREAGVLAVAFKTNNNEDLDGGPSVVGGKWSYWAKYVDNRLPSIYGSTLYASPQYGVLDGTETTISSATLKCVHFYRNAEISSFIQQYSSYLEVPEDSVLEEGAFVGQYVATTGSGITFSSNMTEYPNTSSESSAVLSKPTAGPYEDFSFNISSGTAQSYCRKYAVRPTSDYDQFVRSLDPVFHNLPHVSTYRSSTDNAIGISREDYYSYPSDVEGPIQVIDRLPGLTSQMAYECNGYYIAALTSSHDDLFDTGDWSIAFFAKNPSTADISTPYNIVTGPSFSISANRTADEMLSFNKGASHIDAAGKFPADDEWHLYYVEYDSGAGTYTLAIDGSTAAGGTMSTSACTTGALYFGEDADGTFRFQEIMVYDKLLTTGGAGAQLTKIKTYSGI